MSKINVKDFKLTAWQKEVVSCINNHLTLRESEAYQGVPEFLVNTQLSVNVAFPEDDTASFINYLAAIFPAVVIYKTIKHYVKLTDKFELHDETDMMSSFEVYYAINENSGLQPSTKLLEDIKIRFQNKKVIIIDGSIPAHVKDFIFSNSPCIIISLGK